MRYSTASSSVKLIGEITFKTHYCQRDVLRWEATLSALCSRRFQLVSQTHAQGVSISVAGGGCSTVSTGATRATFISRAYRTAVLNASLRLTFYRKGDHDLSTFLNLTLVQDFSTTVPLKCYSNREEMNKYRFLCIDLPE